MLYRGMHRLTGRDIHRKSVGMTDINTFLVACDTYAARKGWRGRSRLSTLLFNDGKELDRIARGGDIGARRLGRAAALLAEWQARPGLAESAGPIEARL